jgi:hypothetical protein
VKKMKHRSIHIFILVAALLVVAPQASQDLSAMKDALGQRLKSEIFNAFLSLHAGDAMRSAEPASDCLFASAGESRDAKRGRGQNRAAATQVEVHARREVPAEIPAEVAAITEPIIEIAELEPARAEAAALRFELHDTKIIRGRDLAMIIPPDADVTAPPPPPPTRPTTARRATRRRAAELDRRAAAPKVEFEGAIEFERVTAEELRRQLEGIKTFQVDADAARTWTKVLKVKRTAPKPAPAAPAPAARAACPTTNAAAAAPSRQMICGPSVVETFYASE